MSQMLRWGSSLWCLGLTISFTGGQFDPSQCMVARLESRIPRLLTRDDHLARDYLNPTNTEYLLEGRLLFQPAKPTIAGVEAARDLATI